MADQQYYNALYLIRAQQREVNEVQDESTALKKPSAIRYFFLYILGFVGDVLDIFSITIAAIPFLIVIDIIIDVIMLFVARGSGKNVKNIYEFRDKTYGRIEQIGHRISVMRSRYAMVLRAARRIPVLRAPVRKFALGFARFRKSLMSKLGISMLMDVIPILDILPWRTFGVYSMYKAEKQAYLEAQELIPEFMSAKQQEITSAVELSELQSDLQSENQSGATDREANSRNGRIQPSKPAQGQGLRLPYVAGTNPSIKDWKGATEKLNDLERRRFIERTYKGGFTQYSQDEARQRADSDRREQAQSKFRENTSRYDNIFKDDGQYNGPIQVAKE